MSAPVINPTSRDTVESLRAIGLRTSDADAAYERFKQLVQEQHLFRFDSPKLTEADTRAKLIDPVFKDVLGWPEADIRREKSSGSGFADYLLGSEAAYLLIEAKRTKPRFHLESPGKPRRLKLTGPHLLGQRKVVPVLEQAQRYASDHGAQFAIATNGSQFIIFRPYLTGRSWTTGIAIVFHDHDDIVQDFALFHSLLSRDRVVAGALLEAFHEFEGITTSLYSPLEFVRNSDRELVRNPLWNKISQVMAPLLTDQSEDPATLQEVIRNCYVTTPLSDQADKNLDRKLRDIPSQHLKAARFKDTTPDKRGAFSFQLERDIEASRPGTYLLTGGVGSGKTTFLRRFATIVNPDFIRKYCVWIHLDFLPAGNVERDKVDEEIRNYSYRGVRRYLEMNYPEHCPSDGDSIRALFADDLSSARRTLLHGVREDSPEWNVEVNRLVDSLYHDDERLCSALLTMLAAKGLRLVIILDNTDQLGEAFQERVFLFAQRLSQEHQALCIVSLREEKFFAAFQRGIFDAFGDRRFHIGSPDLKRVLAKRLNYGRKKFHELAKAEAADLSKQDLTQIDLLLGSLIKSTTQKNENIVRLLACVSNGDMRHALDMFRDFLSSGNTNLEKITDIVTREGGYTVPFHEFAKSAILGSRKYYRSGRSHIVNVFRMSGARRASHLTTLRILARLARAGDASSEHGEGFVRLTTLLREWRQSFGVADDLEEVGSELLRRRLLESEPPRAGSLTEAEAVRISAAGAYYWKYLVRSFAYLDLVYADTPIADRELARRLAEMVESTAFTVRFRRVRAFLEFLRNVEVLEQTEISKRGGAYSEALVPGVQEQIEKEIRFIAKRTGASAEERG